MMFLWNKIAPFSKACYLEYYPLKIKIFFA